MRPLFVLVSFSGVSFCSIAVNWSFLTSGISGVSGGSSSSSKTHPKTTPHSKTSPDLHS